MDNLIKTLPLLLRSVDSPEVLAAAAVAAWKHAAGEGLRTHAVPLRLEGRHLIVAVADGVWQKQLSTMCAQMVFRVNALLGHSIVDRIELQVVPSAIKHQNASKKIDEPLTENEVPMELWTAASTISDKKLRQSFLKAAISSTKRNELRKPKS